jgi:hypothetical protein
MDDATDANKVVAAIFAASICSTKENKHEDYGFPEYEAFLSLVRGARRPGRGRDAQAEAATPRPGKLLSRDE